jgi:type I restriction enzyme, S subunit
MKQNTQTPTEEMINQDHQGKKRTGGVVGMKLALKSIAIGEIVQRSQTWNPSRSSANEVFQYIDLSAVDQDAKEITEAREVLCGEAPSRARQLVENGDILVSTVRPNLNGVARVPEQLDGATASTGFCVLRPNKTKASGAYLFHWVKSPAFITDMVSKATGASYPAVSDRIIFESQIPLPPLAEQKRIAAILDAADALRTKRRESLAQLDALLQSTFLTLFGDPVANPMGWKIVLLGKTANRITKGQSPNWQGFNYQESGALFVTSENVREGHLDISKPKFVPLEFNQKLKSSQLRVGDLLINLVGASIGRSCLFTGYLSPANVNQAVGIVSIDDPVLTNYIVQLLQTQQGQTLLTGRIVEAARANVSLANLRELPIPLPPLPLQQKFAAIVESVERQKAAQRAHLAELDALFAALQHRAFRGEL